MKFALLYRDLGSVPSFSLRAPHTINYVGYADPPKISDLGDFAESEIVIGQVSPLRPSAFNNGLYNLLSQARRARPSLIIHLIGDTPPSGQLSRVLLDYNWGYCFATKTRPTVSHADVLQSVRDEVTKRNHAGKTLRPLAADYPFSLARDNSGRFTLSDEKDAVTMRPLPGRILNIVAAHSFVSHDYLMEQLYGDKHWPQQQIVKVSVFELNKQLAKVFGEQTKVVSEWGIGYRWAGPALRVCALP